MVFRRVTQLGGAAFTGSGMFHFEGGFDSGPLITQGGAEGNVVLGEANLFGADIGGPTSVTAVLEAGNWALTLGGGLLARMRRRRPAGLAMTCRLFTRGARAALA